MKEIRYFKIIFSLFLLFATYSLSAENNIPKREVRAVWITTIGGLDWPHSYSQSEFSAKKQQEEFCCILDKLKNANVNTVLLQTRIRGTVIYPSSYEPWDGCLSGIPGRSPGYDALQFAIDECHKRGMELHAWVVTIPIGKSNKLGAQSLKRKHPELYKKVGDECYMNPEKSGTARYISDICKEIAANYDVDGIHLDYIRYPETYPMRGSADKRRDDITSIVRLIHDNVKSIKPWIKLGCSPIGKYNDLSRFWSHGWNAYQTVCQDAQGWLKDGLMDAEFPMMYFQGDQFFPFAIDWQENSNGRIIAPGLGIYFMSPAEKDWDREIIEREMYVMRSFGLGHAYFRSKFFTDNTKDIYDFAENEFDKYPALVPAMTWEKDNTPTPPTDLAVVKNIKGDCLSWKSAINNTDAPYIMYNVYSSKSYPVDITDARNLIATRLVGNRIFINRPTDAQQDNYAVTTIDRYGNESEPLMFGIKAEKNYASNLLKNDGKHLLLPVKRSTLDADYIVISDLTGRIVATRQYSGKYADISEIPSGTYCVRSLGVKGKTHRLGFFFKKEIK